MSSEFKKELEKMHLQWFADSDPIEEPEGSFEEGDEEPELVVLGPNDPEPQPDVPENGQDGNGDEDDGLPETYRGMSKADLARYLEENKSKADQNAMLKEILEKQGSGAPPSNLPQQQPGESDEAFRERFNKEVWKSKDLYGLFQEAIRREVNPYAAQLGQAIGTMTRKQLKSDPENGPVFKKYEKEVDQMLGTLSPGDRSNPQALEWAFNRVKENHFQDIVNDRIEAEIEKRMSALEEQKKEKPKPRFSETNSAAGRKKSYIRATEADYRKAKAAGMDIKQYLKVKANRGG